MMILLSILSLSLLKCDEWRNHIKHFLKDAKIVKWTANKLSADKRWIFSVFICSRLKRVNERSASVERGL